MDVSTLHWLTVFCGDLYVTSCSPSPINTIYIYKQTTSIKHHIFSGLGKGSVPLKEGTFDVCLEDFGENVH